MPETLVTEDRDREQRRLDSLKRNDKREAVDGQYNFNSMSKVDDSARPDYHHQPRSL